MAQGVPVILDTCALVWLAEGGKKFTRPTFRKMETAPLLHAPVLSAFEIARKSYDGGLVLSVPPEEWFARLVDKYGLTVLPLDLATRLRAAGLPRIHNDPVDRFIIAAAKIYDCAVVTSDERFAEYGVTTLI